MKAMSKWILPCQTEGDGDIDVIVVSEFTSVYVIINDLILGHGIMLHKDNIDRMIDALEEIKEEEKRR